MSITSGILKYSDLLSKFINNNSIKTDYKNQRRENYIIVNEKFACKLINFLKHKLPI